MIITKLIEIGINIDDPVGLYSDFDNVLMALLKERYVGKCLRNCYVLDINRVVRASECLINQDGAPDFGTINLIFEAQALVYNIDEVIVACKMIKNTHGIMILSSQYADIMIPTDNSMESITIGQIIPIKVESIRYALGHSKIAIKGLISLPEKTFKIYKLTLPVAEQVISDLDYLLGQIVALEDQVKDVKSANASAWVFFEQLLYAYKDKTPLPDDETSVDLIDFIKDNAGKTMVTYVSRDPRLQLTAPVMCEHSAAAAAIEMTANLVEMPPENVLLEMLNSYHDALKVTLEYISVYNTQPLLDVHKNLWLIYKYAKSLPVGESTSQI